MTLSRLTLASTCAAARAVALSVFAAGILAACAGTPARMEGGALVGATGMTLYTFDNDKVAGKSVCNGQCAINWPPLMASESATASGDYSIITRDDGKKQWALKGKPLYYWVKDQKPGDKTGDNFNKVWHVAM